jgi:hypothetical protein
VGGGGEDRRRGISLWRCCMSACTHALGHDARQSMPTFTHKFTTGSISVITRLMELLSLPAQNCSAHQLWPTPLAFTRSKVETSICACSVVEGLPTFTAALHAKKPGAGLFFYYEIIQCFSHCSPAFPCSTCLGSWPGRMGGRSRSVLHQE